MANPAVARFAKLLITQVVPEAPFQPTIAVLYQQKNLPEVWSTLEFSDAANQRLTIGHRAIWREFGSFSIVLVGKAGFGTEALLTLGQRVTDVLQDKQERLVEYNDISGMMRLDSVGVPNTEDYEDGNWLITTIACVYTYDSVRGAAV